MSDMSSNVCVLSRYTYGAPAHPESGCPSVTDKFTSTAPVDANFYLFVRLDRTNLPWPHRWTGCLQ